MKKPDFFIVGAPKSGTTALYSYLKQHPGVFLPGKEMYYFCRDLTFKTPPVPEETYLSYYSGADAGKIAGDASIFYLLSPQAAKNIKSFNPAAKIIIMLRNPVQMVYSYHSQLYFNGDEPIKDFEEALNAEKSRREGNLLPQYYRCPKEAFYYSIIASYYEQVQRYKSVFSEDKIHIILYDDFKSNTKPEYLKVLNFLGLKEITPRSFNTINANKAPRSIIYLKFLMNPPDFIKAAGRFFFPHHSKRRIWIMTLLWHLNGKHVPREPLPEVLKQRMINMYSEEIKKLEKLLNRNLSNWVYHN